ncbi:hypothetical protein [Pseudomonas sp. ABFPK]|uniref:hypothetical protein n=1 Tax=Pseudomonas sp. ABFPK TaxID=1636605 RepID=UPI000778C09B|nr:hypothetical protein [Pseudomonas sp. ABFPK]KYC14214.1 hypothetical protein WM94_27105 [Pseudomonas sp. ABFPK]
MNALEAAQAAVQDARKAVAELQDAEAYVAKHLPLAGQALEAAVARLRRLNQADGTAAAANQQAEIDRLTAKIAAVKEGRHHV